MSMKEPEQVMKHRVGSVLGKQTILKSDHFPGCQNKRLMPQIDGAPNYRQAESLHVHGVAIPTTEGIQNVLNHIGDQGDGKQTKVLWINLREEPIVYINGRPFVLRDVGRPFSNLEYTVKSLLVALVTDVEQGEDGIEKYWFPEMRIPLYLIKEFEAGKNEALSRSAAIAPRTLSKLNLQKKQLQDARKDIFLYLVLLLKKKNNKILSWGLIWKKKKKTDDSRDFLRTNLLLRERMCLESPKPVCALCQKSYNPDLHILCEICSKWYHGDAVELEGSKLSELMGVQMLQMLKDCVPKVPIFGYRNKTTNCQCGLAYTDIEFK